MAEHVIAWSLLTLHAKVNEFVVSEYVLVIGGNVELIEQTEAG